MHLLASFLLASVVPSGADEPHRPLADAPAFVSSARTFVGEMRDRLAIVPAIGVAVVVDDQVVLADGFGMADIERSIAADGDTLFYIASATKPFTALMASILDARGELELGDVLADHLDEGQLDPALDADEILLRDLLCHVSGLENDAIAFRLAYSGEHDLATLWRLVGRTTANAAGRGKFQYTNFGYNLLTLLLERETGKAWQDHLQDEVLTPLGLGRTSARISSMRQAGFTLAAPYRPTPDGLRRHALEKVDSQMQSAGGLVMSSRDAARWLRFQLNAGTLDGRSVVAPEVVLATQQPWTQLERQASGFEAMTACGAGWMIGKCGEWRMLEHRGGYAGFRASIAFLPEARVGVAVFANSDAGGGLLSAVQGWAFDWWLKRPTPDAATAVAPLLAERDAALPATRRTMSEIAARSWQLPRERAAYTGVFVGETLGTLSIALDGERLVARLGELRCEAQPSPTPRTDSIRLELVPGTGVVVTFEFDAAGKAIAVHYLGERLPRRAP